jgi:hypothetical protein
MKRGRGGEKEGGALAACGKKRKKRGSVIFWSPSFGQIRKNIQPLDNPENFKILGSFKLIRAVHKACWPWQFGKIEK